MTQGILIMKGVVYYQDMLLDLKSAGTTYQWPVAVIFKEMLKQYNATLDDLGNKVTFETPRSNI